MFPFIPFIAFLNRKKNQYKNKHGKTRGPYRIFFIDHINKLVYVENPKAASRSILESMGSAHLSGLKHIACSVPHPRLAFALPLYTSWIIHLFVFSKWRLSHETRDWLTQEEIETYFLFTFVRNPFDRLVSGYTNKIISSSPIKPPLQHRTKSWRAFLENDTDDAHSPELFKTFVTKYIHQYTNAQLDVHFKPQNLLVEGFLKDRPLDFIGHIETFETDWNMLAERFDLPRATITHANKSAERNTYETYYRDDETIELVYEQYKDDIERYGYHDVYKKLLEHVRK